MNFTVSTNTLLKELQTISGAISNNTVLPILEDFLFTLDGNLLKILASDLETSMSSILEVDAEKGGEIAIPSRILLETLKALPDQPLQFEINTEVYTVSIKSANGTYNLSGESGEDFPNIPQVSEATEVSIDAHILANAVGKTLFAVSNDELRPAMTGINVEMSNTGMTFVATDAHKLVKYQHSDVTTSEYSSFIVPRKAMSLLKNALTRTNGDIKVAFNNTNAFFSLEGIELICRLIDARFPDYNAVIPVNNPNLLTVNRAEMEKALKRIAIYSSKTTYQVKLSINGSQLILTAEDRDFSNEAEERLTCEYDGEPMSIAFNARFLGEVLTVLSAEQVSIELSTPSRAGVIVPSQQDENEELLMLVMPIMMST